MRMPFEYLRIIEETFDILRLMLPPDLFKIYGDEIISITIKVFCLVKLSSALCEAFHWELNLGFMFGYYWIAHHIYCTNTIQNNAFYSKEKLWKSATQVVNVIINLKGLKKRMSWMFSAMYVQGS